MNESIVNFDRVTLLADTRRVFEDFSWRINTGEHWCVTGPTGSGKTLLAETLCRRVPLRSGNILYNFDGSPRSWLNRNEVIKVSVEDQRAFLQRYGSCHQSRWMSLDEEDVPTVASLLTRRSLEHLSPFVVSRSVEEDDAYRSKRREAVSLLGIKPLLDRRVIHLSNGETRKLLLARALILQPELLILDDPFGGLDPEARTHLAAVLDRILSVGRTRIILMTSRRDEIPGGITHLLQLENCRTAGSGPVDSLCREKAGTPAGPARPEQSGTFPLADWRSLPDNRPLLELRDVSVVYGNTRILNRVTWSMNPGEHWALLGRNGAGKSTLISLFLGDNPQVYANDVRVFGIRRGSGENVAELKARIGWMSPELQAYYDNNTPCRDVIRSGFFDSIGLFRQCSEEEEEKTSAWMDALDISALADHPLGALSAGEQRLAFLARALVKSPAVLVLDEPCQGLDAVHRLQIRSLVDRLCRETPVSLLIVTHHPEELPVSISHVLRLEKGRIANAAPD